MIAAERARSLVVKTKTRTAAEMLNEAYDLGPRVPGELPILCAACNTVHMGDEKCAKRSLVVKP